MSERIYLIGGPPGAGKTTLGAALAIRLGIPSLTIDDLVTAVQAVTTPESHPGLHLMWEMTFTDYFTNSSPAQLIADAARQHEVAWPFIRAVIRRYARAGKPVVIDGWHLWPERVAALDLPSIWAGWIYIEPAVLRAREEGNPDWVKDSEDSVRMLDNFMGRSLWWNETMRAQAEEYGMPVLYQDGSKSVEDLLNEILRDKSWVPPKAS